MDFRKRLNENNLNKNILAKSMVKRQEKILERERFDATLLKREIFVPGIWDFGNNNEATTKFFSDIVEAIFDSDLSGTNLVINLDNLNNFSIESIVYFIAIISLLNHHGVMYSGLLPNDANLKKNLGYYGFHNHVAMDGKLKYDKSILAVECYDRTKPELVSKIRVFTKNNCSKTEGSYLASMCEMIIEMMDNTCNHAYDNIEKTRTVLKRWYICAKNEEKCISYVFLDTGLGIPKTVMRKWNEFYGFSNSKIINSALKGDYPRSSTGHNFRGKGLLQIYSHFKSENCIRDFKVISGRGMCIFNNIDKEDADLIELGSDIRGTIFCWKIDKTKVMKG